MLSQPRPGLHFSAVLDGDLTEKLFGLSSLKVFGGCNRNFFLSYLRAKERQFWPGSSCLVLMLLSFLPLLHGCCISNNLTSYFFHIFYFKSHFNDSHKLGPVSHPARNQLRHKSHATAAVQRRRRRRRRRGIKAERRFAPQVTVQAC